MKKWELNLIMFPLGKWNTFSSLLPWAATYCHCTFMFRYVAWSMFYPMWNKSLFLKSVPGKCLQSIKQNKCPCKWMKWEAFTKIRTGAGIAEVPWLGCMAGKAHGSSHGGCPHYSESLWKCFSLPHSCSCEPKSCGNKKPCASVPFFPLRACKMKSHSSFICMWFIFREIWMVCERKTVP